MTLAACHPERKHLAKGLCSACYKRRYFAANPEARARKYAGNERWRRENRWHLTRYNRRKNQGRTSADRHRHHLKRFGLTPQDYQQRLTAQSGLCAICRKAQRLARRLAVDHDHKTGHVRGLLCPNCNGTLGKIENAEWLAAARAYLRANGGNCDV